MSGKGAKKKQQELLEQLRVLIKEDSSIVSTLFEGKIQEIVEDRLKSLREEMKAEIKTEVICELFSVEDDFVTREDFAFVKKNVQHLYSITEQLENKFYAQENGMIITNVDSVEELREVVEDKNSNIAKELTELTDKSENVEFNIQQVGKKTVRMNLSVISETGMKIQCFDLENKLRKTMKSKYDSVVQKMKRERTTGKKYFIKANRSFIQRKKGQLIYKLVEKIRNEVGECKISWKNGQIQLNGKQVHFIRAPTMILANVDGDDTEYEDHVLL